MINALSVDVEEFFQVSAFASVIEESSWSSHESRIEASIQTILDLFEHHQAKATFFVLGWVAERHPQLIRSIHDRGHEIASHSYAHKLIYNLTHKSFREDLVRSKNILEEIIGQRVIGFRAPSYSITKKTLWALDILIEEGFLYDSSIFPIYHDRYGIPQASRFSYKIRRNGGTLIEFPLSTVRMLNFNVPVAGGGYLRLLPNFFIRWGIRHINQIEKQPAILYFHPWEIDPDQPRQKVNLISRFRHYTNIRYMEKKLRNLISTFKFAPIREVLQISPTTDGDHRKQKEQ